MRLIGTRPYDIKSNINFNGTRTLKNTVSQLAKNNKYSLTEPNQRYIISSISELSKVAGEKTVKFLIDIASKLKYSTNIRLKDNPLNDWKDMLLNAAMQVLAITPSANEEEYISRIESVKNNHDYNKTEQEIMILRDKLLQSVDIAQIKRETIGGIKDFKRNLDYFIVSSETNLKHKKYVLERLNYLMSDKYKINPQLEDKKSIVAAELVNDMAIFTPGHKVPNIKAVNQKSHGTCGAISIVRKKIAYEDKPNYIDSILSELDDSPYITVYDRSKLGSGKKTVIEKPPVDFDAALSKGYRIIDASSTEWMEISTKSGYSADTLTSYTPFDPYNYDVNADSFYNVPFEDSELQTIQGYYQALLKANTVINDYKARRIKSKVNSEAIKQEASANIRAINDVKVRLLDIIDSLNHSSHKLSSLNILNGLLGLEKKYSSAIKAGNRYEYIANEEEFVKIDKIRRFMLKCGINSSKISEDKLKHIYELVNAFHELEQSMMSGKAGKKFNIRSVTELYEIAASTRYQFLKGFENEDTLNDMMKDNKVPNREECMQNTADTLISKLKEGAIDSDKILLSLYFKTGGAVTGVEDAYELLESIKNEIDKITNSGVDKIYNSINVSNKQDALLYYISVLKSVVVNGKDEDISAWANKFGVKNSVEAVSEVFDELAIGLQNGSVTYNSVFNQLGSSSQLLFLYSMIEDFFKYIFTPEGGEMLEDFVTSNNLDTTDIVESINSKHIEIVNNLNNLNHYLEIYSNLLTIEDENGHVLYSPEPAFALIKKLENSNAVVSDNILFELQQHLDKIQRIQSADEFNSRRGRLKDKSLYKFSKSEQSALRSIEKNITQISRYVKKQLSYVQRYIKAPLEELNRRIGLNTGNWWVFKEGESGLAEGPSIRILEYITGRPHYSTTNINKAIEKIKFTPYSGISSSSVFHNKVGMHAQYIADVQPVKIKTPGGSETEEVDVLFHDNSWGASEHENTWVDSNGLVRTDYSDNRGGTLGYITNDQYRNGNLVNRVLKDMVLETTPNPVDNHEYKKLIKADDDVYKAPQYTRITLDGRSPDALSLANSIYDSVFTPTSELIKTVKDLTKDMRSADLTTRLYRIKSTKNNWEEISDKLMRRIHGEDNNSAIITEEDYNSLPDNDILKIMLEKAALIRNYSIDDYFEEMHGIQNVNELNKFKGIQKRRAIRDFSYSFGKNSDIVKYLAESITQKDLDAIVQKLGEYGLTLSDKDFADVFYELKLEADEFDGSIRNMINILISHICVAINDKTNVDLTNTEFTKMLQKIYSRILYFNSSDIKNPYITNVVKFIDRVYNPSDDTEFVKIFRRIQNMTNEEFRHQIVPQLTNEDLNIKNGTGYELLKRIQRYETSAENALNNTIYADESLKSTEGLRYRIKYTNNKLHRTSKMVSKYTFDAAYNEMKGDLSLLTLPKRFAKYKEMNFNLYGAFPAYPKVNYMSESMFNSIVSTFIEPITEGMEHINSLRELLVFYDLSDKLKHFASQHKPTDKLNAKQYKSINEIFGQICTSSYNDESVAEINAAALDALELERGVEFSEYQKYIDIITGTIDGYQKITSKELIEQEIAVSKSVMSKQSGMLVEAYIRTRYQNKFAGTLNKFKQSFIKHKRDINGNSLVDVYREQLINELKECIILQEPEELLDRYIESLPVDSKLHKYSPSIENMLKRALDFSKLSDIQATLMSALRKGIETDVKSVFNSIQIPLKDGTTRPMSSAAIIGTLVHSLIYDNEQETALLLLDKLGLNETYVNYIANEYFDYDDFKSLIEDAANKHKLYKDFTAVFNESYKTTEEEINSGVSAIRSINRLKRALLEAAKVYSIEKSHLKIFLNAINDCKLMWQNNPDTSKVELFDSIFYPACTEYEKAVATYFEAPNRMLESQELIMKLMNNVPLETNSKAAKNRVEVNKKFRELVEYNNKLMSDLQANQ